MTEVAAGPELDAIVAEKVMGERVMRWGDDCPRCGHPCSKHGGGDTCLACQLEGPPSSTGERCGDYDWDYARPYSTTGDGMLLLLERMRELGWVFITLELWDRRGQEVAGALMQRESYTLSDSGPRTSRGEADTLPEAVCRAALQAVEG